MIVADEVTSLSLFSKTKLEFQIRHPYDDRGDGPKQIAPDRPGLPSRRESLCEKPLSGSTSPTDKCMTLPNNRMKIARQLSILAAGLFLCGTVHGASYPVKISPTNPHVLVDRKNVPFMIFGDSPHSLFSNLTSDEAAAYLANRSARGMNALWVNLLCMRPVEGRPDASLIDGTKPFTQMIPGTTNYDLTTPNEAYFAHVDECMPTGGQEWNRSHARSTRNRRLPENRAGQWPRPLPDLWPVSGQTLPEIQQLDVAQRKRLPVLARSQK